MKARKRSLQDDAKRGQSTQGTLLQVSYFIKDPRLGRKVAIPANEANPAAPLAASGAVGGEPRKEEARVRRESVLSGARRGPVEEMGEGLKREREDMRTRNRKAARSVDPEPGSQPRARASFSQLIPPLPPPFRPVVSQKPEES